MLIDWPTVIAQLINFAILVFALKYFLYDRVVAVMEQRQQKVRSAEEEAQQRREEADAMAEELEEERQELKSDRDQIMKEARREADQQREERLEEARAKVDRLERAWRRDVRTHQERLVRRLQEQTGRRAVDISRRALSELAAADLEERIIAAFSERLEDSVDELKEALQSANGAIAISTAFDLGDDEKGRIEEQIRNVTGSDLDFEWNTDGAVIAGISISAGSYEVGWTIDRYLTDVGEELKRTLTEELGANGTDGHDETGDETETEDAPQKSEDETQKPETAHEKKTGDDGAEDETETDEDDTGDEA